MSNELKVGDTGEVVEVNEIQNHDHHWMIESPNGRTSPGVCIHCGETRDFINSSGRENWGEFTTRTMATRRKRKKPAINGSTR